MNGHTSESGPILDGDVGQFFIIIDKQDSTFIRISLKSKQVDTSKMGTWQIKSELEHLLKVWQLVTLNRYNFGERLFKQADSLCLEKNL